jgi:hypothetical protein
MKNVDKILIMYIIDKETFMRQIQIVSMFFILILLACSKKEDSLHSNMESEGKPINESVGVIDSDSFDNIEDEGIVELNDDLITIKNFYDVNYITDTTVKNGAIIEIIQSAGMKWTIRKLEGSLSIWGWREDTVEILDKPRGNVIYRVKLKPRPSYDVVHLLAITKETDTVEGIEYEGTPYIDHWVKILIDDDKSGWIFGRKLDVERGGPKYLTPENVEPFVLEDGSKEFEKYYIKENVMN